jgi:hypothetical protein
MCGAIETRARYTRGLRDETKGRSQRMRRKSVGLPFYLRVAAWRFDLDNFRVSQTMQSLNEAWRQSHIHHMCVIGYETALHVHTKIV